MPMACVVSLIVAQSTPLSMPYIRLTLYAHDARACCRRLRSRSESSDLPHSTLRSINKIWVVITKGLRAHSLHELERCAQAKVSQRTPDKAVL